MGRRARGARLGPPPAPEAVADGPRGAPRRRGVGGTPGPLRPGRARRRSSTPPGSSPPTWAPRPGGARLRWRCTTRGGSGRPRCNVCSIARSPWPSPVSPRWRRAAGRRRSDRPVDGSPRAPLGAHWDGAGTSFAVYSSVAETGRAVPARARRRRRGSDDGRPDEVGASSWLDGHVLVDLRARRRAWRPLRLPGPRPVPGGPRQAARRPLRHRARRHAPLGRAAAGSRVATAPGSCPTASSPRPTSSGTAVVVPRVPWVDTVVYEAHVKGLTARHPQVPEQDRGTYRGLGPPRRARAPRGAWG